MRKCVDSARLEPNPFLESRLHAVERVPSEGRGKPAQFIPIRFIFRNKLTKDDRLLLAFDALVLSQVLGRAVSRGKIIHGDDHATLKVKTSALAGEVRERLDKLAALLSSPTPPDLVLNRHCAECEFQARCRKIAVEKDDLSLLAGMSAKERQKLRSKGIFTVTQLSYTFRPRRRPKRLRDKREKYHHSLKALAIREKKIHIVGSPELKIEGTPVYLDVEGLPDRDFFYLIGLRIGNGESAVQHSLWADTVEDEGKIWREFLALLETVEKPVLIHYGSYETAFLKQMSERHGGQKEGFAGAGALDSTVNLLSFIFGRIYFPTYSNGLKEIGSLIGATWRAESPSGTQSIVWRCAWEACRSDKLKLLLQVYNENDCQALCLLFDALRRIGPEALTLTDVDFAHTPKRRATERGMEIHQAFDWMRRSAHADYQQSRIYLKKPRGTEAPPREKRARISPIRARDIPSKSGCVISAASKRNCPEHPEETLTSGTMVEHRLIDLVFTKNGCRKTVVRYVGRRKTCPWCGVTYVPPAIRRLRQRIFGHRFQAWVVYHRIALRLPMGLISKAASDLFSVKLAQETILGFMTQFAIEHTLTERRLLGRILAGPVVHVDETKINIFGEIQYVWVMTDGEHVIFRLTATREATLIQKLLHGYHGILVSDFYGGYDTLPCRQQKCLVHLIRDLNDDLWKNPFNAEYESFVSAFRDLLTPILNDAERFGLKARHLRKHEKAVERFYQRVILDAAPRSEVTACYVKRFIRHRDSLFRFLNDDGVPWNNNAAERALRHFAVQRKISNSFSAQGAQQYLRLLGIAQTCRFQEKSFLRFLLSGSHDVDAYQETRSGHSRRTTATITTRSPADESAKT
jgi:predicted RecB family nuclease